MHLSPRENDKLLVAMAAVVPAAGSSAVCGSTIRRRWR